MATVFVFCMAVGGLVLVGQILLSFIGFGGDMPEDGGAGSGALNLLSVRAVSAAAVVFGATGLTLTPVLPGWLAGLAALVPAVAAALGTAWLTRQMYRAESSGNLRLDDAVGQIGRVYLSVPGNNTGHRLVQFALQGRTVELVRTRAKAIHWPRARPFS
jgi:hypothetical protein